MKENNALTSNQLINNRYEIVSLIAKGAISETYLAHDKLSNKEVAVKMLLFSKVKEWKELELFEREALVLKNINHPNIPDYIDNFNLEINNETHFILVQEYVKGRNLKEIIESGKRFSLGEVENIFKSLLEILIYIHNLKPAVIHRDIKPNNIILDDTGKIYLVDFGSVGNISKDTITASNTFVGTIGYMPQEQLYGKVMPASDLYSLGMTIIYILTGRDPINFDVDGSKVKYEGFVNIPQNLKLLLDKMIAADYSKRLSDAQKALDYLNGKIKTPIFNRDNIVGDRIKINNINDHHKEIKLKSGYNNKIGGIFILFFSVAWDSILTFMLSVVFKTGAPVFLILFFIPFIAVGIGLPVFGLYNLFGKTALILTDKSICLTKKIFNIMLSNKKIDFNDYQGSDVVKEIGQQRNETFSVNMHGVSKSIKFGKLIGLEEREARYIIDLIDNHVKENIIL